MNVAMTRARNGAYKIIYVAPEKLLTNSFINLCRNIDIFIEEQKKHSLFMLIN